MGYFFDNRTVIASLSIGADGSSPQCDVRKYSKVAFQTVHTPGGGSPAGNLYLEGSIDATNWVILAGTTQAYTSATTSLLFDPVTSSVPYIRLSVDNTSGAGGTIAVLFSGVWTS